mgnify:CR=1 FL=1
MKPLVVTKKTQAPAAVQGGAEREYPWPIISAKSCCHLDWYPMLGDLEDGTDDYECEVCALCGAVRNLQRSNGGGQAPVMRKGVTLLVKAAGGGYVDWKNDPRYRWITMRPHGEDGEGYPVLIRMDDPKGEKGSGTVVGGAGGSMNYRRVTGVRSKADYQTEARSRRAERESKAEARTAKRVQEARDAGLTDADLAEAERQRKEAREQLQEEATLAEAEHLAHLAEIMGWEVPALSETQLEGMTTKTKDRIERERRRRMLKEAEKAVQNVQDSVIKEHDRAVTEAIGQERVEDLAFDEVDDRGLGYVAKVETLAKEAGMTKAEARALSRATTDASLERAEDEGYIKSAIKARMYIDMLQQAGADARTEDKPFRERGLHKVGEAPEHLEPDQARALLVAHEQYKQKQREFQAKEREITDAAPQNVVDVAVVTRGDALVRMGKMTDEEAMAKVEESLQARARITAADRLLSRIEELEGGVESVEQHLLEGRHVQLQEVAQAVFSQPLTMRREVLDLLGPEAGGTLMAYLMRQELGEDEREAVRTALREEHIETQVDRARTALEDAQEHFEAAQAAFAGFGTVGELGAEGLEAASAAKAEKLRELREARQILGVTLGRLQMLGSMNAALAEGEGRTLDVPLGQITGAQAWQVGAALGLARGEYEVQSDGPNKYIRISRDAFGKLIESPDPEQKEQYEAAVAIKRGDFDEDGWLAEGLMKRPSEKYYDDPDFTAGWGVDAAELLEGKHGAEFEAGIREYAGRMLANGGAAGIGSLRQNMLSALWQADNLDDRQRAEFAEVVAKVFPADAAEDNWTGVAEELVKPFIEQSNAERAALDAQNIDVVSARDPIHRALQACPEGKVAFTPISRMTPQDKALLRQYFWNKLTDEKPPSATESRAAKQEQAEAAEEVVATQMDIFGNPVEIKRGETEAFQEKQAEADADRGDHAWARYVKAMKGVGNAYATVQSLIQGDLAESFAKHYARETGRGLRTAPADVPNALRHVIGLMPKDALERVLDADNGALREMYEGLRRRDTRGRYSEGEVANLAVRILEKAKKMQLTLFGDASPGAQRLSIGATAEKQLKQAWAQVAPHFDPERPAHIIENLAQSGPKYVHQQRAIKMLEKAKRIGLHHSTGCIAGTTLLLDPVTGAAKTVREHHEQRTHPRVLAVRPDGSFAVAEADVPFVKGVTRLLTVRTEAGREVTVAPNHLFLTERGWRPAADLTAGDSLCAVGAATGSDATRPASERSIHEWDRVSNVVEAEVEEYFDFEVPVYHNYVAHGLVHHNSGKSLASLGAFTHLHSQGKVQRGLYMVPPKIQAQFGGEINAYAEPGRYSHFSDPSASASERRAAYADPEKQMVVISHQAWRDDVTWAVAQERFGGNEQEAADWLRTAERGETAEAVRAAVDAQGWSFDMNVVDEGHDTLNRKGKPDSRLARVIDATTDRAEYMMTMTATPVKNDTSEAYDLLRKVRPDKFPADGYEDFRRRYALNTEANREALQRLVAPYFYAKNVDTGVEERHSYTGTDLSPWQKERYRQVLEDYNTARSAPEGSDARREAIRALVPDESLRDLSPEQVAQKLDDLGGALGFTRDRAIARVLEHAPAEHNPRIQKVVEIVKRHAGKDDDGGQVPGLIFSQSLESVRLLADALKKEGLRVGVITGELSGADSELRRMDFNADGGRGKGDDLAQEAATRRKMAKYDIIVGSGAAGTGLNMERARFLVHYDQPWTAKEIAQRNGRQNRLSQHWGEVEVHTLGTDVPYDRRRRELVERKAGLMTTFMEPTEQLDDTGLARRIREARAERLSDATETELGFVPPRAGGGGAGAMQEAAT